MHISGAQESVQVALADASSAVVNPGSPLVPIGGTTTGVSHQTYSQGVCSVGSLDPLTSSACVKVEPEPMPEAPVSLPGCAVGSSWEFLILVGPKRRAESGVVLNVVQGLPCKLHFLSLYGTAWHLAAVLSPAFGSQPHILCVACHPQQQPFISSMQTLASGAAHTQETAALQTWTCGVPAVGEATYRTCALIQAMLSQPGGSGLFGQTAGSTAAPNTQGYAHLDNRKSCCSSNGPKLCSLSATARLQVLLASLDARHLLS